MRITINGTIHEASDGQTILEACREAGTDIPTLCNYEGHENGVCRLCMVQIEGAQKPVPACSTQVRDEISVVTDSDRIRDYRKTLIGLILKNHGRHDGESEAKCSIHSMAREYGVSPQTVAVKPVSRVDDSHPAIEFHPDLCIECRKCVIACRDEQNNEIIEMAGKGQSLRITFDAGASLGSSGCVSCGACTDVCPSGALIEKGWMVPERTVTTICPYCAVGCTVEYGVRSNIIIWARGVSGNSVNDGKLCVKGKFGFEFESSRDRLLYPMVRRKGISRAPLGSRTVDDVFRKATWDEALGIVASRIREIKERLGPRAIAGIACDRATNEDVYAFQKFMRAALGSDNVDQSATLCHSPSARMLSLALGAGSSTNPVHDLRNSRLVMVVGSNTDRAHPVVSSFIKRAKKDGTFLIVIDPRRVELAERADIFLQIRPGSDAYLFSCIARYIVENNLYDSGYVREHAEGFEEYTSSLRTFDLDAAYEITGVSRNEIERVAKLYAESKPASIYWTLGITEHSNGSDNVSSLVNLAILTGNIGIPGGGLNPLRGQNNVQGGADVGGAPGSLPGYQNMLDPEVRQKFEGKWNVKLPREIGWKSTEMIEKAIGSELKLMYISGENSIRSHPNSSEVDRAFRALDFLVVQDIFMTETAEYADIILPAASTFEKTGTFTNTERRIQLVRKIFDPPGEAMPDWKIYSELSDRLGYSLSFDDSRSIMDEISDLVPAWHGVSHSRLEKEGLKWPVADKDLNGTEILHSGHPMRGKAKFRPIEWNRTEDAAYPFVMITGRKREQYHTATMTSRSHILTEVGEGPFLEMSSHDMKRMGLSDGDMVEAESAAGRINCLVKESDSLTKGVTFATFHFSGMPVNVLTSSILDPLTKTPAYKDTRIRIRKI